MRGWVAGWVAGVVLSLVAGCGTVMGGSTAALPPPPSQDVASGSVATPIPTATTPTPTLLPVRFGPCGHQSAREGTTNLRVEKVTAKNSDLPPGRWTVRLKHVTRLRLPGGKVAAGNGYEALTGGQTFVTVADGTVTADVTMAVVEGGGDSRVAFVELRLGPGRPVSWVSQPVLDIVTDGGDGGFVSAAAQAPYPDEQALIDHYVDALSSSDARVASSACPATRQSRTASCSPPASGTVATRRTSAGTPAVVSPASSTTATNYRGRSAGCQAPRPAIFPRTSRADRTDPQLGDDPKPVQRPTISRNLPEADRRS